MFLREISQSLVVLVATKTGNSTTARRVGRRTISPFAGLILGLFLAPFAFAAPFTVTNTNDTGAGSLRQAILDANALSGLDTISFSIGSGVQTISPLTTLPTITDPIIIDGTTQPVLPARRSSS